jgi:hypothetical protein
MYGNFYQALSFGKTGKKGTEDSSKVFPSHGNIVGINAIITS